ncbi:hypothetical protein CTAYLR_002462 [Chrysophaeum taylorii]|uniref:Uncharacterized protein n=1 Tax=Chrysophaeum taylorii TaxID=2483200 RepID=A0AAD7UMG1_9STRA|nr:hypothetical protein CTAYLR_002462 [Chrysophaeum taylorii]
MIRDSLEGKRLSVKTTTAQELLQNNQALAMEIAELRRGNERKIRKISALTRDLLNADFLDQTTPPPRADLPGVTREPKTATTTPPRAPNDETPARATDGETWTTTTRVPAHDAASDPDRRSRRNLKRLSYAEPSLKAKMRRPRGC